VLALYNFAAAAEFARAKNEPLASRRPAVVLLVIAGLGFLSWLPLNAAMPIQEAQHVLVSFWFPATILLTLLLRIALAFIVLSMAKERRELEQRAQALTDALTGLPNRRALFEVADTLSQDHDLRSDAISVLIFDLDHFKQTNDRFGHDLGDRVLKLFAMTAQAHLNGTSIVARLGGEEFVAILPDADPLAAANAAESVRRSFASAAASVDGLPVGGTVSVGVAWMRGSAAISMRCFGGPMPPCTWPSEPAATASSCWVLTTPIRSQRWAQRSGQRGVHCRPIFPISFRPSFAPEPRRAQIHASDRRGSATTSLIMTIICRFCRPPRMYRGADRTAES
jgi:diguanylate cyclase (GGDEF)-like protein